MKLTSNIQLLNKAINKLAIKQVSSIILLKLTGGMLKELLLNANVIYIEFKSRNDKRIFTQLDRVIAVLENLRHTN